MKIYIIRHGTTTANREKRFQGHRDYPLCGEGIDEARRLARRLCGVSFDAVYCSDLRRARETAQIIAREKNLRVKPLKILREFKWGIVEGRTWPEIQRDFPFLAEKLRDNFYQTFIPGQETWRHLRMRIRRVRRLLVCGPYFPQGRVALVSHGRFLNAFLVDFFGLDFCSPWPFPLSPASLTIVEVTANGQHRMCLFNDTCHLLGRTSPV